MGVSGTKLIRALRYDPVPKLRQAADPAILFFAERDLLGERKAARELWSLSAAHKITRRQEPDGRWTYPAGNRRLRSKTNYDQLETYRNLGFLAEKYAFTRGHAAIRSVARFLFSFQTREGDFRGIYGDQYSPNYSAGITELLIKAGYQSDPRILKSLRWLLSVRQDDGGWAIPFRTRGRNLAAITQRETLAPDPSKPSSFMVTGVVLRAFAAHPAFRRRADVRRAAELVVDGFFKPDPYPDRRAPAFWERFAFPFWFNDLLSSLDSLSRCGFRSDEPRIQPALRWFVDRQRSDGGWNLKLLKTGEKNLQSWIDLSICRVFRRFDPA